MSVCVLCVWAPARVHLHISELNAMKSQIFPQNHMKYFALHTKILLLTRRWLTAFYLGICCVTFPTHRPSPSPSSSPSVSSVCRTCPAGAACNPSCSQFLFGQIGSHAATSLHKLIMSASCSVSVSVSTSSSFRLLTNLSCLTFLL